MEIRIRSISHTFDERAMGHCLWWPTIDADVVSCTHNPDGFSPMLAVIRALGRDRGHFTCPRLTANHRRRFVVISHGFDERPMIITSSRTVAWESEPRAASEIIRVADIERARSICLTHFSFLPGRFPALAFEQCVRAALMARYHTKIAKITIDVDVRFAKQAGRVLTEAQGPLPTAMS